MKNRNVTLPATISDQEKARPPTIEKQKPLSALCGLFFSGVE